MKTVAEFMATSLLTAAPRETVTAVVRRLTDHGIGGLPVLEGGAIVGMVTLKDLVGQPPYRPVQEVMVRDVLTVAPTERITDAYALMDSRRIGRLPVVDHGVLVGIVTRGDLLKELGRLTDPMTDLPWSGTLRQEAADLLKEGREVSVLFIDLDDFGIVNKLYGHVVGDRVITAVARLLREATDGNSDVICRYAGDEFAIVTTRTMEAAMALALQLRQAIVASDVPGAPPGAVSAAIGIAGGKRSVERHDIHYDATVDDLITMASRASTMAKRTKSRILHSSQMPTTVRAEPGGDRVAIRRIDLGIEDGQGTATVELELDGRRVTGQAQGSVLGSGGLRLLVDATMHAVRHWLPAPWDVAVEEIARTSLDVGEAVHILLVMGSPLNESHHILGSALYTADPHEAVVKATMKAMNRVLEQTQRVPA